MTRQTSFIAALALGVLSPGFAFAQTGETRSFPAVFSAAAREPRLKQNLGVGLFVEEGFSQDRDDTLSQGTSLDSGLYTGLGGEVRFDWRGEHVTTVTRASSNFRYYRAGNQFVTEGHTAAFALSARLGKATNLIVNQSFDYTPAYLTGLPTGSQDVTGVSASSNAVIHNSYAAINTTSVALSRSLLRRGTATFISSFKVANAVGSGPSPGDLSEYAIGGSYNYGLARDLSLVLGYTYRKANYTNGLRPIDHAIDAGVDYHKSLSLSRRTTFTSTFGSAIVSAPAQIGSSSSAGSPPGDTQFQLRGSAQLAHHIGRTWQARAMYRREVGYLQELRAPVLTDGWSVATDGFLNRRVDLSGSVSYTAGTAALTGVSSFKNYTGVARLRMATSKSLAMTVEYQYYYHDFLHPAQLAGGVPPRLDYSSIRGGVTYWIPVRRK